MKQRMLATVVAALSVASTPVPASTEAAATAVATEQYCLRGEMNLGARLQGMRPAGGEWSPASWCVVSEVDGPRVRFRAEGRSNPDLQDDFTLAYLAPDRVRIVNADAPPDIEFRGATVGDEALAVRRIDPERLVAELEAHPEWVVAARAEGWRDVRWPGAEAIASVQLREGRVRSVRTTAEVPLRGRVPVVWNWTWSQAQPQGTVEVLVDGQPVFRATGERRVLDAEAAAAVWAPSGGQEPTEVPGSSWPASVRMRVITVQPGVHLVRGVRTGFQHLVVETAKGLVVADAPAGWVELHQLPPRDLVPGLGISGLSERFIGFLRGHFPDTPIRAVALTHFHDDHAGGARAFAAVGAEVYAPAASARFLERALNREAMPMDWLKAAQGEVEVRPVDERVVLADDQRRIELLAMGEGPHVGAMLGVHVPRARVFFESDVHVPVGDGAEPRAGRAVTDCWFAAWAKANLPADTVVYNSHSGRALTVEVIAGYLAHERCGDGG